MQGASYTVGVQFLFLAWTWSHVDFIVNFVKLFMIKSMHHKTVLLFS